MREATWPLALLTLLAATALAAGWAVIVEAPAHAAGLPHPAHEGMQVGGSGESRHGPILVAGGLAGLLAFAVIVALMAFAYRGGGRLRVVGWWLAAAWLLEAGFFTALMVSYAGSLAEPPAPTVLGFPRATAWLLYALWPSNLLFVAVFVITFERAYWRPEDAARLDTLLGEGAGLMDAWRHPIILGCVGLYMAACVVVGIWALRRTKSVGDFFVAGRSLGIVVTAIALFSSLISGFAFVGGPGLVYHMGMSSTWMAVGMGVGGCLSVMLVAKRIRIIAEVRNTMSLPDVVAARYDSEWARGLTAATILLGVMGYLATQMLAMSVVLRTLLVDAGLVDSIPLEFCVVISCAVLVFYCTTGGIIAGVYTDLFQGAIMLIACVFIFITARGAFDGGFTAMAETIAADDRESMGPWGTAGMLTGLSWMLLFAVGACGQPHVLTKHMMFKHVRDVKGILVISALAGMMSLLLVLGIGMTIRALVIQGRLPALDHPDAAAPVFLQRLANPLLAGVVFAALFAAVMSTADSFLNVGTAAIVHDLPRALRGRPLRSELFWARVSTVIVALAAAVFGLYWGDLVALLGAFGWSTFAAALVPVVAIGCNWKRATATAVNATIVFSLAMNFTLRIADVHLPRGIDGGALTLVVSIGLFFAISLLSRPPAIADDIAEAMEL